MQYNKICFLQNIINKTILSCQKYKLYDIFTSNEINICINSLENIYNEIDKLKYNYNTQTLNELEEELISIIQNYGTESIIDLIKLLIGENYIDYLEKSYCKDKFNVIKNFLHPIYFKIILGKTNINENNKKSIIKNRKQHYFNILFH